MALRVLVRLRDEMVATRGAGASEHADGARGRRSAVGVVNRGPDRPHFIAHNQLTRLPRRWIVLDTEAHQVTANGVKVQSFRCGAASLDAQSRKGRDWQPTERGSFVDPEFLWRWVDERTRVKYRTVVVAH